MTGAEGNARNRPQGALRLIPPHSACACGAPLLARPLRARLRRPRLELEPKALGWRSFWTEEQGTRGSFPAPRPAPFSTLSSREKHKRREYEKKIRKTRVGPVKFCADQAKFADGPKIFVRDSRNICEHCGAQGNNAAFTAHLGSQKHRRRTEILGKVLDSFLCPCREKPFDNKVHFERHFAGKHHRNFIAGSDK